MTRKFFIDTLGATALLASLNGWQTAASASADLPLHLATGRYGAAAVVVGDAIYVTGGCSSAGLQGDVEKISPASFSVTTLDVALLPRRFHAAATSGDRVYIVGGDTDDSGPVPSGVFECWDTATGKVEILPPLPNPRRSLSAVIYNDFLFVIGGSNAKIPVGALDVYDIRQKTWSTGPAMPMPRECSAVLLGDRIFVPGGYDYVQATQLMHIYMIDQATWVKGPSLPQKVSANHVAAVGNTIVSCGDYGRKDIVLTYNALRGHWGHLPDYKPARHVAAAALGRRVYAIGGNVDPSGSCLDTIQVIQPPA